jgi:hypothetical protein
VIAPKEESSRGASREDREEQVEKEKCIWSGEKQARTEAGTLNARCKRWLGG